MAREDLLARLLIQLTEKEGPPPEDDNSLIQKMIAPNDSAQLSDNGVNLSLLNPATFVWGGAIFNAASFARNSNAYLSNGILVTANTPRYETGQFGQAIMIEEGTTNLVTNGSFENGISGCGSYASGTSPTISQDTIGFIGAHSLKIVSNNTTAISTWLPAVSITAGTTYTFTCYTQETGISGKSVYLQLSWRDSNNNTITYTNGNTVQAQSTWHRLSVTGAAPTNSVKVYPYIYIIGTINVGDIQWIDAAQVEAKPYATSYTDSTRVAEVLKIPNPIDITKPWTIEHRFIAKQPSSIAGASNWLGLSWFDTLPSTAVWVNNGLLEAAWNNTQLCNPNISFNAGDIIYYAWRYDGTNMVFSVGKNGASLVTTSIAVPTLTTQPSYIYIGSDLNGNQQSDVLHDDFRVSNKYRTDAEIAQAYASGQPLPVDSSTTCKLNFDSNLNNIAYLASNWNWGQGQWK
ncbi:hypothetical protein Tsac_2847 [Thermoanaerobacterium phage THSA-485A]|uniref:hypothetical protein n=1 Tax=Thermoanaerobacterium phage THSA-485A TaxID=1126885 RepID=UPI000263F838|nr:hypothetical protein Tsac_2847 [Thermoanaerobacterium phage THSA-485A]AFK87700.1 hypothetical protein Tsac_2847 [Thermoanaerobacterium phage THSA-485A]